MGCEMSGWRFLKFGFFMQVFIDHTIFLHCYAEIKEMIYESVNLKGIVYEPKQKSVSLQSISTCTGFAEVHLLRSEQVFN